MYTCGRDDGKREVQVILSEEQRELVIRFYCHSLNKFLKMEVESMHSEPMAMDSTIIETNSLTLVMEDCTPVTPEKNSDCESHPAAATLEVRSSQSMTDVSKKRTAKEECTPVLIRIPSKEPSCGSDIIYINKDQVGS